MTEKDPALILEEVTHAKNMIINLLSIIAAQNKVFYSPNSFQKWLSKFPIKYPNGNILHHKQVKEYLMSLQREQMFIKRDVNALKQMQEQQMNRQNIGSQNWIE